MKDKEKIKSIIFDEFIHSSEGRKKLADAFMKPIRENMYNNSMFSRIFNTKSNVERLKEIIKNGEYGIRFDYT